MPDSNSSEVDLVVVFVPCAGHPRMERELNQARRALPNAAEVNQVMAQSRPPRMEVCANCGGPIARRLIVVLICRKEPRNAPDMTRNMAHAWRCMAGYAGVCTSKGVALGALRTARNA